jgi:hypothetical protein
LQTPCPSDDQGRHGDPPRGGGRWAVTTLAAWVALAALAAIALAATPTPPVTPDAGALERLSSRLAPVDLAVDLGALPLRERAALAAMIEAARLTDTLFLRQAWAGNETLLLELLADDGSRLGRARLHAFLQNKGPWLRLDHDRPFVPGVGAKPTAPSFYPADASKDEVERWMRQLSPAARASAEGFFTTIRRAPGGALQAIPYSVEYQGELARAASLLREAAAQTEQPTLRAYLEKRAAAFLSNDYYDSDVAWMKLDGSIEPTIGPYEVYEDSWFSAKAAFEAYVSVTDAVETSKLAKLSNELQEIEDHLPIDAKLRNPKLGALAPIRVVNSLFWAGDANKTVVAAAFNLPNDERIAKEMGTKRTLMRNVQEAKFKSVLLPISRVALAPADRKNVAFDAFFTHIVMHELMHGLGPHETSAAAADGKRRTVRAALQETYGAIEEAKADIAGLFALQYLIDKGVLDRSLERTIYVTFLASAFRSIRFGGDAHAVGMTLQINSLLDAGAFAVAKDGTFSVDAAKAKGAVRALTGELMTLQAAGDRGKAVDLLRTRAVPRPEVERIIARLAKIPVDIEPRFVTAEQLLAERRRNPTKPR